MKFIVSLRELLSTCRKQSFLKLFERQSLSYIRFDHIKPEISENSERVFCKKTWRFSK